MYDPRPLAGARVVAGFGARVKPQAAIVGPPATPLPRLEAAWVTMILRLALLLALALGGCSSMQRELSDDEWCKSFEDRYGTREYGECRQRIAR
jgi:hypothetical protein